MDKTIDLILAALRKSPARIVPRMRRAGMDSDAIRAAVDAIIREYELALAYDYLANEMPYGETFDLGELTPQPVRVAVLP